MKRALVLVALFAVEAGACVWFDGTDLRGKKIRGMALSREALIDYLHAGGRGIDWKENEQRLRSDPKQRNDYAGVLMHLGRAAEAVPILEALEREQPGKYATAANLGTAYELTGKNVEALRWIRESIRRSAAAHDGTEWLHVRILEAKIAGTTSVLGLDFGSATVPVMPKKGWPADNSGKPAKADRVIHAIFSQLHERLQFVKPPEPLVGDLLFDFANLQMLTRDLETAEHLFAEAIRYGAPRAELAAKRRAYIRGFLGDRPHTRK